MSIAKQRLPLNDLMKFSLASQDVFFSIHKLKEMKQINAIIDLTNKFN